MSGRRRLRTRPAARSPWQNGYCESLIGSIRRASDRQTAFDFGAQEFVDLNIGTVSTLDDAVATFNPTERRPGKTIIRVRP